MRYVYISGPYSSDPVEGIRNALGLAEQLIAEGYTPFVPHLTHFWHLVHWHEYEYWMRYDLAMLPLYDAVLRLPGVSPGADRECAEAERLGIPVVYTIEGLKLLVTNERLCDSRKASARKCSAVPAPLPSRSDTRHA